MVNIDFIEFNLKLIKQKGLMFPISKSLFNKYNGNFKDICSYYTSLEETGLYGVTYYREEGFEIEGCYVLPYSKFIGFYFFKGLLFAIFDDSEGNVAERYKGPFWDRDYQSFCKAMGVYRYDKLKIIGEK